MLVVNVWVSEDGLLGLAEGIGEGVTGVACDGGLRVGDNNAVLDVKSLDFAQGPSVSASVGDELSYNSENRVGVDNLAWAVELLVALAVRVEIASVGISNTSVSVSGVGTSTSVTDAHGLPSWVGRVRGESGGDGIGLPDIHLSAARAVSSITGVCVVRGWDPSFNVGLNRLSVLFLA